MSTCLVVYGTDLEAMINYCSNGEVRINNKSDMEVRINNFHQSHDQFISFFAGFVINKTLSSSSVQPDAKQFSARAQS